MRCCTVAISVGLTLVVFGCKKKEQVEETAPPPQAAAAPAPTAAPEQAQAPRMSQEALPGAAAVRAALKKKDYSTAVSGLMMLRGPASHGGDWAEYRQLNADVGMALKEAARTDANAAQALQTYQLINMNR